MSNSPLYDANQPIKSRAYNEAGRANYDKIFRKGEETIEATHDAMQVELTLAKLNDCPGCTGRGYHIIRETGQDRWGKSKQTAYRKGCTTCDETGKVER